MMVWLHYGMVWKQSIRTEPQSSKLKGPGTDCEDGIIHQWTLMMIYLDNLLGFWRRFLVVIWNFEFAFRIPNAVVQDQTLQNQLILHFLVPSCLFLQLIKVNQPDLVLFVGEALVGNEAVDQLTKFNQALADYSSMENPHQIDGIVLTKYDTIDDKVL